MTKPHAFAYLNDYDRCWHCGHFRSEHSDPPNDGPYDPLRDPCRRYIEGKPVSELVRLNFSPAIRLSEYQSLTLIAFLAKIERIYARTCPTCVIPLGQSQHVTGCAYEALIESFKFPIRRNAP